MSIESNNQDGNRFMGGIRSRFYSCIDMPQGSAIQDLNKRFGVKWRVDDKCRKPYSRASPASCILYTYIYIYYSACCCWHRAGRSRVSCNNGRGGRKGVKIAECAIIMRATEFTFYELEKKSARLMGIEYYIIYTYINSLSFFP